MDGRTRRPPRDRGLVLGGGGRFCVRGGGGGGGRSRAGRNGAATRRCARAPPTAPRGRGGTRGVRPRSQPRATLPPPAPLPPPAGPAAQRLSRPARTELMRRRPSSSTPRFCRSVGAGVGAGLGSRPQTRTRSVCQNSRAGGGHRRAVGGGGRGGERRLFVGESANGVDAKNTSPFARMTNAPPWNRASERRGGPAGQQLVLCAASWGLWGAPSKR